MGLTEGIRTRVARRRGRRWSYAAADVDASVPEPPTAGEAVAPPAPVPTPAPALPTEVTVRTPAAEFDRAVPSGLQVAAAWSWRVLLVVAMVLGLGWLVRYLSEVAIPVALAILLAALLSPVANRLRTWGAPRGGATALTVLGGLALIAGSLILIGTQIVGQAATLSGNVVQGFYQLLNYLRTGPIPIPESWLDSTEWSSRLGNLLRSSQSLIAEYAAAIVWSRMRS